MSNFSCFTMIIAHELPSNDITKTNVSMGSVKLDIVTKCQYRYMYVAGITTPIAYTNNLTVFLNGQDIVNVGSGAIGTKHNVTF